MLCVLRSMMAGWRAPCWASVWRVWLRFCVSGVCVDTPLLPRQLHTHTAGHSSAWCCLTNTTMVSWSFLLSSTSVKDGFLVVCSTLKGRLNGWMDEWSVVPDVKIERTQLWFIKDKLKCNFASPLKTTSGWVVKWSFSLNGTLFGNCSWTTVALWYLTSHVGFFLLCPYFGGYF